MSQWKVNSASNVAIPAIEDVVVNSPAHLLQHVIGRDVQKSTHTIDGNGAQTDNIFVVTGVVQVHLLALHVNVATDSTTFSGVKFGLYDGTATLDITGTVDGSGCIAGDFFYKKGLAAAALQYVDTSVGVISEAAANKVSFEPFFAGKKSGASTWIQLLFTGDANTDIEADFEAHFTPMTHDGNLVAV